MEPRTLSTSALLRLIRDARSTEKAERHLLNALALRCRPSEQYKCWPSYDRLCLDTCLSLNTLKTAARSLEAKQLILRRQRRNRANLWFLNVALLQEQADAVQIADAQAVALKRATVDGDNDQPPFAATGVNTTTGGDNCGWDLSGGAR